MISITTKSVTSKIKDFSKSFKPTLYQKGQTILYSNQMPAGVYYLQKGNVRQFIVSPEGKELTIHIYQPGAFFPLFSVINKTPADFNLQALSLCEITILPAAAFVNFLKNDSTVLYDLTTRLLAGIDRLSKRIEVISLENARTRVISTLLYLANHFAKKTNKKSVSISQKFTHEDLATLTGLTRERVSIEMKNLKRKGLVFYTRGNIVINDIGKLQKT